MWPGMHQFGKRQSDGRFEACNAKRAALELLHFFVARMRRMIRRNRIHRAIAMPSMMASTSRDRRSGGFIL